MTCDRVVIIENGKLIAQDTPAGLIKSIKGTEKLTVIVEGPLEEVSGVFSSTEGVRRIIDSTVADGACSFTLDCDFRFHVRKSLSQIISEKGWSLLEMKVEEASLEDVFLHLTAGGSTARETES